MNNKLIEEKLHDGNNSEVYDYDSVYRLTQFDRGAMNAGKTGVLTPTTTLNALQAQLWTLDGIGNWNTNRHTTGGVSGG